VVDRKKYLVYFEGIEFQLPKKEFDLLVVLTFSPSRVFTRDEIYNRIRVDDVFVGDRTIDVYVRNLSEEPKGKVRSARYSYNQRSGLLL